MRHEMSGTPEFSNADQVLIHRFMEGRGKPIPMVSNPLARAMRCRLLHVDFANGMVEVHFEPDPLFVQGTGVLQGGAVSAMLDFAMAFSVLALVPAGHSCATVNMNTSFHRPAPQGRYRAVGEIEHCGKSLAFARARLFAEDSGGLVASGTSTLALLVSGHGTAAIEPGADIQLGG